MPTLEELRECLKAAEARLALLVAKLEHLLAQLIEEGRAIREGENLLSAESILHSVEFRLRSILRVREVKSR